jgi:hypothetical protein
MNDVCIVVGTHPSDSRKTDILEECLQSLRITGLMTIVSAHSLPDRNLNVLCDYYLYDAKNDYIPKEELLECLSPLGSHGYIKLPDCMYRSQVNLFTAQGSHHYAAFLNMINGAKLAREKGFKYMLFTEGDNIFHPKDLVKFLRRISENIKNSKKGIFFQGHPEGVNGFSVLVCFIEIDFFLSVFGSISKREWIEIATINQGSHTAEKVFMHVLKDLRHELDVLHIDSPGDDYLRQYFPNSRTNIVDFNFNASKILPVANFCSKWSPEFDSEDHYWFVSVKDPNVKRISSLIEVKGEEFLFASLPVDESFSLSRKIFLSPLFTEEKIFFKNSYEFKDETVERSFVLTGDQLRKYLQLNTLQFNI